MMTPSSIAPEKLDVGKAKWRSDVFISENRDLTLNVILPSHQQQKSI